MDTNEPSTTEEDSALPPQCNGNIDESPSKLKVPNVFKKQDVGTCNVLEKDSAVNGSSPVKSCKSGTTQDSLDNTNLKSVAAKLESNASNLEESVIGKEHKENNLCSLINTKLADSKVGMSSSLESSVSGKSDLEGTESNKIEENTKSIDTMLENDKLSFETNSGVDESETLNSPDNKSSLVNSVSFSDMNKENKLANSAETKLVKTDNSKESFVVMPKPKKKQKARKSCQSSGTGSLLSEESTDSVCNRPASPASVSALTKKKKVPTATLR